MTEHLSRVAEVLTSCECGHGLDEHNGLGCYARLSYEPLVTCSCALTDDRTDADLVAQRLPAHNAAVAAEALRDAATDGAGWMDAATYLFLHSRADHVERREAGESDADA